MLCLIPYREKMCLDEEFPKQLFSLTLPKQLVISNAPLLIVTALSARAPHA